MRGGGLDVRTVFPLQDLDYKAPTRAGNKASFHLFGLYVIAIYNLIIKQPLFV